MVNLIQDVFARVVHTPSQNQCGLWFDAPYSSFFHIGGFALKWSGFWGTVPLQIGGATREKSYKVNTFPVGNALNKPGYASEASCLHTNVSVRPQALRSALCKLRVRPKSCKPSLVHEGRTYKNKAFFVALFSRSRLRFFSRALSLLTGIALLVSAATLVQFCEAESDAQDSWSSDEMWNWKHVTHF